MDSTTDPRVLKARLFGDEHSDHLHKKVIKARFLRNLQQPTGGIETCEVDETATEPSARGLPDSPVRIARYAVLRKVGEGGMGVVYVAYDEDLDRKVAIKLLRNELSKDERGRARMLREAQALARLSHPNVVQVHEVAQWGDFDYVAMEYVDGQTLDRWLADKRSWQEVLEILIQAGRGLEAAHAAGLVHRDFKPANLLIGRDGRARVLDFGLARSVDEPDTNPRGTPIVDAIETVDNSVIEEPKKSSDLAGNSTSAFDKMLTMTGTLLGTPAYMAPEQHLGEPASALSDQFSFCVVLYEALFGQRPFKGGSRTEYALRVTEGQFEVPPLSSGVPGWLRKIVMRGLAPKARDRWPSMSALLAELRRDRTRTWRGFAVAGGLLGTFALALLVSGEPEPSTLCGVDPASVEDSWGDTQRDAVRVAFEKTGMVEADAVLEHTQRSLDAYAKQIVSIRADACEKRWVARSQTDAQLELRGACLEQRERELVAVVEVLADADREVVMHAPELIAGLGDVGLCARVDLLEVGTPAPKDAATVAKIADVRGMIAQANAAREAGRIAEAKALTAKAWRVGKPLGFEPLVGELHNLEAQNAESERKYVEAKKQLIEAVVIAQRNQSLNLAAEAWLSLAHLDAKLGKGDSLAFDLAEAAIIRLGSPPRYAARLALVQGVALMAAKPAQALQLCGRAVELAESGFAGSEPLLGKALAVRARASASLGNANDARTDLERAIATGANTTRAYFDALFDLAVLEMETGQLEQSERDIRVALRGYESLFGPQFETIGHGQLALGNIALTRDDLDAADAAFERASSIIDEEHADYDWVLDGVASAHARRNHFDAAQEALRTAISHREKSRPRDDARIAYLHMRLANMIRDSGDIDGALVEFGRAIEVLDQPEIEAPLELAAALFKRGETLRLQGQLDLALDSLERAVGLVSVDCGDVYLAGETRVVLARTLNELGIRQEEQKELARTAIELLEDLPSSAKFLELARELSEPVSDSESTRDERNLR